MKKLMLCLLMGFLSLVTIGCTKVEITTVGQGNEVKMERVFYSGSMSVYRMTDTHKGTLCYIYDGDKSGGLACRVEYVE